MQKMGGGMSVEYSKIDNDTLEVTDTNIDVDNITRATILARRINLVNKRAELQGEIDECDIQIGILDS